MVGIEEGSGRRADEVAKVGHIVAHRRPRLGEQLVVHGAQVTADVLLRPLVALHRTDGRHFEDRHHCRYRRIPGQEPLRLPVKGLAAPVAEREPCLTQSVDQRRQPPHAHRLGQSCELFPIHLQPVGGDGARTPETGEEVRHTIGRRVRVAHLLPNGPIRRYLVQRQPELVGHGAHLLVESAQDGMQLPEPACERLLLQPHQQVGMYAKLIGDGDHLRTTALGLDLDIVRVCHRGASWGTLTSWQQPITPLCHPASYSRMCGPIRATGAPWARPARP